MLAFHLRLSPMLGFVVVLTALSCSGEPQTFTASDTGAVVSAMSGEELDVKLTNIGPATYGDPVLSSTSVRFDGVSIVAPFTPAGPTQLFKFTAASPGAATITIPKTGDPSGTSVPFTLAVNVR